MMCQTLNPQNLTAARMFYLSMYNFGQVSPITLNVKYVIFIFSNTDQLFTLIFHIFIIFTAYESLPFYFDLTNVYS